MQEKNNKGFTIIELVVFIAIFGGLIILVTILYNSSKIKKNDQQRAEDLREMHNALLQYYHDNQAYPDTKGKWQGMCSEFGSYITTGERGFIPNLSPQYIARLPIDPDFRSSYNPLCGDRESACYVYNSNGIDFKLLAHCTPRTYPAPEEFADPVRPLGVWAVYSNGARNW